MEAVLNDLIDQSFDRLVQDTRDLVAIESVLDETVSRDNAPFGEGIARALELALKKAKQMGFYTKNTDGYAGYAQYGTGGDLVGILTHLDVVPAAGDWCVPPYSAKVLNGRLYGRGSVDDKGPGLACLYAMKAIKDSGLPISHRVRMIWGTDEETFARGIHYYLDREEAPDYGFSPDAEFPVIYAEKGIARFQYQLAYPSGNPHIISLQAGSRLNIVPDLAKAVVCGITEERVNQAIQKLGLTEHFQMSPCREGLEMVSLGTASHACYPEEGYNAIENLLVLLDVLLDDVSHPLSRLIHVLAAKLQLTSDGKLLGIACSDPTSGALTINLAILQADSHRAVVKFDMRYPVTQDGDALLKQLEDFGPSLGAEYSLIQHKPPLYVEKDQPVIKALQRAYSECTGQPAEPISIGGGTYCRYVKNTVSFGPVFPGQKELAHQANEYISLEDLRKIAKIYAQAIYNLIR